MLATSVGLAGMATAERTAAETKEGIQRWKSNEAVHRLRARGRPIGSPVRIDPLFTAPAPAPARVAAAAVTFEPGARTAWHTHPLGQTLIVISGLGRAQREGGPIEEIRPGDVVWIPPGEKHWHGASPATAMTHIAIQESLNGKVVEWMEHVTDEQYGRLRPTLGDMKSRDR